LYVNAIGRGKFSQRMWVLQRDHIGGNWKLGLWDTQYWGQKNFPIGLTPPYSWLVSTGRKYPGDKRSGPTPIGVFSLDERRYRLARGYASPGMINVVYIDLHYTGGRRSGVAFHGTTYSRYRRLGSIDSHGCIRMTQKNALAVLNRLQGRDGVLSKELRWGDVPRYWRSQRGSTRYGYTRSGVAWPVNEEQNSSPNEHGPLNEAAPLPRVLTKTGYRAIAIIFQD
ncbi:MAG: L,D-transpeptidase, partial [Hyphomicrobiaceae bacterium]